MKTETQPSRAVPVNLVLLLLLLLGVFSGAYYSLRFGGLTMEVDSSRMTLIADWIKNTATINNRYTYSNGVSYGVLIAVFSLVTGLEVQSAQLASFVYVFPLLLAAFIAFREMLGNALAGLLATLILLLQPDFLFYIVRGSHEKFTWAFALLMLYLLFRSQKTTQSSKQLLIFILLFYFAFWGMVMSNTFFASAYLLAISLGLLIGWLFARTVFRRHNQSYLPEAWLKRLLLISTSCFILYYIFTWHIYVPAQQAISLYEQLVDRVFLMFLDVEPVEPTTSVQYFATAWRSQSLYLLITGFQWLTALGGFAVWIWSTFRILQLKQSRRFLWQMYTSFGILLLVGVIADSAGWLSQNLQLRAFTPFAILTSAMFVHGLQLAWPKVKPNFRRGLVPLGCLVIVLVFLGAQIKITNDPMVGNAWLFYTPAEISAYEWVEARMEYQAVWVDTRDHLREVFYFHQGYTENRKNFYYVHPRPINASVVLLSERVQYKAFRQGLQLPSIEGRLRVYDNGSSAVYRWRPLTPYQR